MPASSLQYLAIKRLVDVAVSSAALAVSTPVILAAGMALVLETPGPMFYRSRRVGLRGREFDLLKLRTMVHNQGNDGPQVTSGADSRTTRLGKFLRKTKIDELPQFINVVLGDVSLVGPRPEAPKFVAMFPKEYQEILSVKPGLSDRATLDFVDEEGMLSSEKDPEKAYVEKILPKKIERYLDYVRNPSLQRDFQIVVETAALVLRRTLCSLFERVF